MKDEAFAWMDQYRDEFIKGEWPTIPEMFNLSVHRFPQKVCFTAFSPDEIHFSFQEAQQIIRRTSAYLISLGVKKGDRVALTGKNSPAWAMAYLAVIEFGAVIVPIDYQMEKETAERILNFIEAEVLFVDKEKYDTLAVEDSTVKTRISLSPERENFILDLPETETEISSYPSEDDLAAILFTSGTTGNEKGVMLSHSNFSTDALQANHPMFLNVLPEDILYALLPLHHSYCMTAVFLEAISIGCVSWFLPEGSLLLR